MGQTEGEVADRTTTDKLRAVLKSQYGFDPLSPESGFSWYKVSKLEHKIINVRHIQLGASQLAARLRATLNVGLDWVGAGRGKPDAAG
jgi:hypothetical protein